jgi:HEPN domain-containing protein
MKKQVDQWIVFAEADMNAADILIDADFQIGSAVVFHCQQAIEKYFKAYLIEHDWQLKKTHDLSRLYENIVKIRDLDLDLKPLQKINILYIDTRYPDESQPTKVDAKEAYEFAQEVEKKIRVELNLSPRSIKKKSRQLKLPGIED